MERIGIYGGTFDPVHVGHLILARDAVETLGLARMIFVPAAVSPHKLGRAPGASGADRLAMLHAAVADEPAFEVDALELDRPGPSYTFDTVAALRARLPDAQLHYLIGADNVPELHTWHRADELRALARFVVFGRRAPDGTAATAAGALPTLGRVVDCARWHGSSSSTVACPTLPRPAWKTCLTSVGSSICRPPKSETGLPAACLSGI